MGDIPAIIIKECAQYLCVPVYNQKEYHIRPLGKNIQEGNNYTNPQSLSS